eukprot:TRINITY_DN1037_c0_g1_i2.p1 TRINITY_DN1037_c0_g1~~TRINITY_DN1037_c0_g1_i2.p1  ORF type:complete len:565 (+),score=65.87 TRINITY_DN1037_c0_g1_i2:599-2293(+)
MDEAAQNCLEEVEKARRECVLNYCENFVPDLLSWLSQGAQNVLGHLPVAVISPSPFSNEEVSAIIAENIRREYPLYILKSGDLSSALIAGSDRMVVIFPDADVYNDLAVTLHSLVDVGCLAVIALSSIPGELLRASLTGQTAIKIRKPLPTAENVVSKFLYLLGTINYPLYLSAQLLLRIHQRINHCGSLAQAVQLLKAAIVRHFHEHPEAIFAMRGKMPLPTNALLRDIGLHLLIPDRKIKPTSLGALGDEVKGLDNNTNPVRQCPTLLDEISKQTSGLIAQQALCGLQLDFLIATLQVIDPVHKGVAEISGSECEGVCFLLMELHSPDSTFVADVEKLISQRKKLVGPLVQAWKNVCEGKYPLLTPKFPAEVEALRVQKCTQLLDKLPAIIDDQGAMALFHEVLFPVAYSTHPFLDLIRIDFPRAGIREGRKRKLENPVDDCHRGLPCHLGYEQTTVLLSAPHLHCDLMHSADILNWNHENDLSKWPMELLVYRQLSEYQAQNVEYKDLLQACVQAKAGTQQLDSRQQYALQCDFHDALSVLCSQGFIKPRGETQFQKCWVG